MKIEFKIHSDPVDCLAIFDDLQEDYVVMLITSRPNAKRIQKEVEELSKDRASEGMIMLQLTDRNRESILYDTERTALNLAEVNRRADVALDEWMKRGSPKFFAIWV